MIDGDDQDIQETSGSLIDIGASIGLARVEIDMQIATARAYPRRPKAIQSSILQLAILDDEAAKENMYALPRGGKPVTGPSVRFAEIVQQAWGNNRASSRIVEVNRVEKYVEAEGLFLDLETNVAKKVTHRRRIVDKRGVLFSDDMILVTGNAACSIAMRESILKTVPKSVWRAGYEAVVGAVKGDVKTLVERRDRAIKAFAAFGIKPEQVFAALGVAGEIEIGIDHLPTLFGMFSSIKNGEHTVEEIFDPRKARLEHETVKDALKDTPATQDSAPSLPSDGAEGKGGGEAADSQGSTQAQAAPQANAFPGDTAGQQGQAPDASATHAADMSEDAPVTLLDEAREQAHDGKAAFDQWFNRLKPGQIDELKPYMAELGKVARAVDKSKKGAGQ